MSSPLDRRRRLPSISVVSRGPTSSRPSQARRRSFASQHIEQVGDLLPGQLVVDLRTQSCRHHCDIACVDSKLANTFGMTGKMFATGLSRATTGRRR
jgi:hypothetical protein